MLYRVDRTTRSHGGALGGWGGYLVSFVVDSEGLLDSLDVFARERGTCFS